MHYCVGAALATYRVYLATFDDENIDDPDIQAVRERVSFKLETSRLYASHETSLRGRPKVARRTSGSWPIL